jgi:hypothetical protein
MLPSIETLNEQLYQEWGESYGLVEHSKLYGNASSLRHLVDEKYDTALVEMSREWRYEGSVFDHARYFVQPPARTKVSVLVTAPYEKTALEHFGSRAATNNRIHQIAAEFGVFVRVGHPADTTYLSRIQEIPIIPIVWWNPERIELPYPSLEDQYETHRGRWSE